MSEALFHVGSFAIASTDRLPCSVLPNPLASWPELKRKPYGGYRAPFAS